MLIIFAGVQHHYCLSMKAIEGQDGCVEAKCIITFYALHITLLICVSYMDSPHVVKPDMG